VRADLQRQRLRAAVTQLDSSDRSHHMKCTRQILLAGTVALALGGAGCVIETGPDGGGYGGCYPNLILDYALQDGTGAPITCAAAGAASVQANVDGVVFPATCPRDASAGSIFVPLQGPGLYNATVNVFDRQGNPLATAQSSSFNITTCGDTESETPAVLVVAAPPAGP
jgi:hypothetical protein